MPPKNSTKPTVDGLFMVHRFICYGINDPEKVIYTVEVSPFAVLMAASVSQGTDERKYAVAFLGVLDGLESQFVITRTQ